MELYKPISDSDGAPVLALPLATVVGISLVKDLYEDIKRHLSDRDENNRKTKVAMKNREGQWSFQTKQWKSIRVGQIIKIE